MLDRILQLSHLGALDSAYRLLHVGVVILGSQSALRDRDGWPGLVDTLVLRTAAGCCASIIFAATLAAPPATAHDGGSSRCVTKHEWRHAKVGVKKGRVHAIFDIKGKFVDGFAGGYTRRYRPCAWDGGTDVKLYVSYNGGTTRVVEKRIV